jgi:protein phosphatase
MKRSTGCLGILILLIICSCALPNVCSQLYNEKQYSVHVCFNTLNYMKLPAVDVTLSPPPPSPSTEDGNCKVFKLTEGNYTITVPQTYNASTYNASLSFGGWKDDEQLSNSRVIKVTGPISLIALYGPQETRNQITTTIEVFGLDDDANGTVLFINGVPMDYAASKECNGARCWYFPEKPGNTFHFKAQEIVESRNAQKTYQLTSTNLSTNPDDVTVSQSTGSIEVTYEVKQRPNSGGLVVSYLLSGGRAFGDESINKTIFVMDASSRVIQPNGTYVLPLGAHMISPKNVILKNARYVCTSISASNSSALETKSCEPFLKEPFPINGTISEIKLEFKAQYKLDVRVSPPLLFSSTIGLDPEPEDHWYDSDSQVELTAPQVVLYEFKGWLANGANYSDSDPWVVTVSGPMEVAARYELGLLPVVALAALVAGICSGTAGFLVGRNRGKELEEPDGVPPIPPYPPAPLGLSTVRGPRQTDEDSILVTELRSGSYLGAKNRTLLLMADGVGGRRGGEIASTTTCRIIAQELSRDVADTSSTLDPGTLLARAVGKANTEVFSLAKSRPELDGMAAALTAALIDEGRLHVAHVGDCRAYLIRSGTITQLTRDHTYVQELLESGQLSPSEARIHPKRNALTRAVGNTEHLVVDTYSYNLASRDQLLLCTDGLTEYVTKEEILNIILQARGNTQRACDMLVDYALRRGSNDNISVVLLAVPFRPPQMP